MEKERKENKCKNNNGVFITLRGQSPILIYPRRKVRLSAQTSSLEQERTTNGTIPNGKVRVPQVPIVTLTGVNRLCVGRLLTALWLDLSVVLRLVCLDYHYLYMYRWISVANFTIRTLYWWYNRHIYLMAYCLLA